MGRPRRLGSNFRLGLKSSEGLGVESESEMFAQTRFFLLELVRLLPAQYDFALHDHLFVEPEFVFVAAGLQSGANRAAQKSHAGRRLKDVGTERAAIDVEFDLEIAGVGDPGDLVAGFKHDCLWDKSYQDWAFRHFSSLKLFADRTIAYLSVGDGATRCPLVQMNLSRHLSHSLLDPCFGAP